MSAAAPSGSPRGWGRSKIVAGSAVDSPEAFREKAKRHESFRNAQERLKQTAERIAMLLAGRKRKDLEGDVRQLKKEGLAPGADMSEEEVRMVEEEHERADEEYGKLGRELAQIDGRLDTAFGDLRTPAEVEEDLAVAIAQRDRLLSEGDAVQMALDVIHAVARRMHDEVSPRLSELATEEFVKLTGDHYTRATVGANKSGVLQVSVTRRGRAEPVRESSLSQGTADQLFLALRVALARLYARSGEPVPLIVDDPFVNYDPERMRRAVRSLAEIARTSQVILFTCQPAQMGLARQAGANVVELDA